MSQLKLILPVFGVLAMVVPGAAQATVCHHFIASTSCNGGGVNDVCDPSGGGAGPTCDLAVNGGSGIGTLTAVSVFTSGTMYSNKPFGGGTVGGGGSHHWEMWGTDTAGNNFCCVYNPAPTWTFDGSPQQDTILLTFDDGTDEYTIWPSGSTGYGDLYVHGLGSADKIGGSNHTLVTDHLFGDGGPDEVCGRDGDNFSKAGTKTTS